jgi:hypothetical protein
MNEKIKQLALEAGIGFTLWDDSGREMIDNYTPEEDLEKFAELIVKECVDTLEKRFMGDLNREDQEVHRCIDALKQHFGDINE